MRRRAHTTAACPLRAGALALALGVAAAAAAAPAGAGRAATVPAFTLFGWVSPPVDSITPARMDEMAALGLNLVLPAWDDSGRVEDNLRRLDLAEARGMRVLPWDWRFTDVDWSSPAGLALADSICADYRDRPGFFGYYFGDEPRPSRFASLDSVSRTLQALDPTHPLWNNLLGRAAFDTHGEWTSYVGDYADSVRPAVLCDDHYDFLDSGDRGQFVENVAGLAGIARAHGVPFWGIVQLVPHGPYRPLTPGELEWQVGQLLAWGARGVGYFTYWTPAPDTTWNWGPAVITYDGARTPWYDVLRAFDPYVLAAGGRLAGEAWVSTQYAGSVPEGGDPFVPDAWLSGVEGRAAVGRFFTPGGGRELLVVNSDSLAAHTLVLHLPWARRAWRLEDAPGRWTELAGTRDAVGMAARLGLEAGAFALVRMEQMGGLAGGVLLRVLASPTPARGAIRLSLSRPTHGGRIEVLDALGRRVWVRKLETGERAVEWDGHDGHGDPVAPGVYVVRAEDEQGLGVTRFVWLGTGSAPR